MNALPVHLNDHEYFPGAIVDGPAFLWDGNHKND
jgi:hypothetical protein